MNKIRMIADRETNYIYHMLSVARCGYDNDYGAKYRGDYPEEDLATVSVIYNRSSSFSSRGMASNFALAILSLDDGYGSFKNPEILEGIIDYLKTEAEVNNAA